MLTQITKAVFALFATLLALFLIITASLGVWVMTGPKSLVRFVPYIEASLNQEGSSYRITVSDAVVSWDSIMSPIDFRLRDVAVFLSEGQALLMTLPEASIGLNKAGLLRMKIIPESIVLRQPNVRFYRDSQNVLYVGIGRDDSQRIPLHQLLDEFRQEEGESPSLIGDLRSISVQSARLMLGESGEARLFDAKDANFRFTREEDDSIKMAMDVSYRYGEEKTSYIRGDVRLSDEEEMLKGSLELRDFSPQLLTKLFPDAEMLSALDIPLSGSVDILMGQTGQLNRLAFRLQGQKGVFALEEHFAEPLPLDELQLSGEITDDLRHVTLSQVFFDFGQAHLQAEGEAHRYPEGWTADIRAKATDMPVNDLYKYWPKTIAPTAYTWVTTHIREGMVPQADARLLLTKEDLGQPFPESALVVSIKAEGVEVNYLDGYPKVEEVAGIVSFTGKGMTITSQKGRMLSGSVLRDAWLEIPDLAAKPAPMHITLAVDAPAADVARFVGIPALGFAEPLGLNPETIQGNASGNMHFNFLLPHLEVEDKNPHLTFRIKADVQNGAQPDFLSDMQLSGANGLLTISEQELTYDGTMALSGAPLNVKLNHLFKTALPYPTSYHATGVLTVEQLQAFGIPPLPFASGTLAVDTHIKRNKDTHHITGTADLTQVAADVTAIGLGKAAGVPAQTSYELLTSGDVVALEHFILKSDEMHIEGAAVASRDLQGLQELKLDRVEYGDNNLALELQRKGGGYQIRANGPSLDLQPFFTETDEEPRGEAEEGSDPFANLDLKANIEWVVFGKERELRQLFADVECGGEICQKINIHGLTGRNNRFSYVVKPMNGVRELTFQAADAGGFLKALNLFDNMQGGTLHVRGAFADDEPEHPFRGELRVTEHIITNAPVLAKIASLLSLSGIGDALQGKGITFKEIESKIGYADEVLSFKDGRAYGPALGITLDNGTVNIDSKNVQVNGTVVPSYTLNSVLGNIPLIGEALSGGKGEGVFAATYNVEGKYPDKVEVSVNPLSMLAPGFLRKIFGGGGEPAEPLEKAPSVQKEPATVDVAPEAQDEVATPPSQ